MKESARENVPLYVGLDAGGSKTRAMARAEGWPDLELLGPAANLQVAGIEGVVATLTELVRRAAGQRPGARLVSAVAGVSGAGRPDECAALESTWRERVQRAWPHAQIRAVNDAVIALEGAFGGGSGIMVIVGTGSIAYARDGDEGLQRAGGWGRLLGDEGGGYALGLAGLKAVAAAFDGGTPTALTRQLNEAFGLGDRDALISAVYKESFRPPAFASHVVAAAEQGDGPAQRIVQEQAAALAEQIKRLAGRCASITPQIAFVGGLTNLPSYVQALEEATRSVLPDWRFQRPLHDPAEGALQLAIRPA